MRPAILAPIFLSHHKKGQDIHHSLTSIVALGEQKGIELLFVSRTIVGINHDAPYDLRPQGGL